MEVVLMPIRNSIAAVLGLWFICTPWVLGFSHLPAVVWTSTIIGFVQLASALLALKKSGLNILHNWLMLLTGIWFAIFSMTFSMSFSGTWTIGIFGIVTVIFVLWNMDRIQ
jgi:hypothetical protein